LAGTFGKSRRIPPKVRLSVSGGGSPIRAPITCTKTIGPEYWKFQTGRKGGNVAGGPNENDKKSFSLATISSPEGTRGGCGFRKGGMWRHVTCNFEKNFSPDQSIS